MPTKRGDRQQAYFLRAQAWMPSNGLICSVYADRMLRHTVRLEAPQELPCLRCFTHSEP